MYLRMNIDTIRKNKNRIKYTSFNLPTCEMTAIVDFI